MIDWTKLEDYDNSKNRSFEEFCYQIAYELFGKKGIFTPIDDRGGGDGVEFYLTLPNGDEWGWQAKFFHPHPRLSYGNRKKQIEKSLKTACEKHPNLKKWFLCTPTRFTTKDKTGKNKQGISEKTWFEKKLTNSIPHGFKDLELIHWNESDFNNWLSEQRFNGKKNYFFGELELTLNWFEKNYNKFKHRFKFEENLHTETTADISLKEILIDETYVNECVEEITDFKKIISQLDDSLSELNHLILDYDINELLELINSINDARDGLNDLLSKTKDFIDILNQKDFEKLSNINLMDSYTAISSPFDDYNDFKLKYTKILNKHKLKEIFESPIHKSHNIVFNLLNRSYYLIKKIDSFKNSDLHIIGDAGIGKTDVVLYFCQQRLNNRLPALIIAGSKFKSSSSIKTQLKDILDIPTTYSWSDFLDSLQTAGEVYNTRIPIIIDGLNEATDNYVYSNIWEDYLLDIICDVKERNNIVLITTCRPKYANDIWDEKLPKNTVFMRELNSEDTITTIKKYFKFYKINANLTHSPLTQFSHPLYLRIFCEITNHEREKEVEVYIGEKTLFEVFDELIKQSNKRVCKRLGRDPRARVVQSSLNKIANYLWKNNDRSIPHDKLFELIDKKSREEIKRFESKAILIEDEGLLIYRDMGTTGEVVSFTYDLFGGYVIANYLIEKEDFNLKEFINSEATIDTLFGKDFKRLNPLYEDIRRCFAALIPIKNLGFLHEFSNNEQIANTSMKALFEISPDEINKEVINFIKNQFKESKNREFIFNLFRYTLTHKKHPLNSLFLYNLLNELEINDRDLSWTEYIRNNLNLFEKDVERFEKILQEKKSFADETKIRLNLFANYIMWFLTSTTNGFRDKTTRALYWYGRRFPEDFLELVEKSLEINDPYVSERMLASAYGVSMALQHDFDDKYFQNKILPVYGRKLFDLMFKKNALFSTTHILKRDYAKRVIEIALIHHPHILSESEKERIKPPFKDGGIRKWGESVDRDKGKYRDMNYPMEGIVYEDPVSLLGHEMDKYQKNPPYRKAKANLWWRIYQLGYSLELFGEIDKDIESLKDSRYQNSDERWDDTYGRKYVFIAVHELAGYRDDLGLLKDEWESNRTSLVDLDPSFPNETKKTEIINEDLLGNRDFSINEWLLSKDNPSLKEYLILNEINGQEGPWVLLDGYVGQTDEELNRQIYIFPRGFFVKSADEEEIVKLLNKQDLSGRWFPEIFEEHYVFAGEIPWCDTFRDDEWDKLTFNVKTELVPVIIKRQTILKNGKCLSTEEEQDFYECISDKVVVTLKDNLSRIKRIKGPNRKLMALLGQFDKYLTDTYSKDDEEINYIEENTTIYSDEYEELVGIGCKDPYNVLELELKKRGLERRLIEIEIQEEKNTYKDFEVLLSVRNNEWGMKPSSIIPGRSVSVPNKKILLTFELCIQPQKFDFLEKNGTKASMYVESREKFKNNQHFVYLRKDLLDQFLSLNDYQFVWVIWGGKEYYSLDFTDTQDFRDKNEIDRSPIKEIRIYK